MHNIIATLALAVSIPIVFVAGRPVADHPTVYWREALATAGTAAFNPDPTYKVFRNVKDYGAKGDGKTIDTAAIEAALNAGQGRIFNTSTTTSPAVVYFPPGIYIINNTIPLPYYTTILGSAISETPSILKVSEDWPTGHWMLDANPYQSTGLLGVDSINNFHKEIRDIEFDLRPALDGGAAIHWPTSQANLLQNLKIKMSKKPNSNQVGIFCESGSGGFMSDIVFEGGSIGLNVGNQQFVTRGLKFRECETAVNQIWDWTWVYQGILVDNCGVGINMSSGVGSITVLDSTFINTPIAILTPGPTTKVPTGGSVLIDNTRFINSSKAVHSMGGEVNSTILDTGSDTLIANWALGHAYQGNPSQLSNVKGLLRPPPKDAGLLDNGTFLTNSRPTYEKYSSAQFITVKSVGAKGDAITDDTAAIQKIFNDYCESKIIFFDAGVYIVRDTLMLPAGCWVVGEGESVLTATGDKFADPTQPRVVLKVGKDGDSKSTQISGMMFSNRGGIPGAILLEWNIDNSSGSSGIWTTHARIGGAFGTHQRLEDCPTDYIQANVQKCSGPFLKFHVKGSGYFENMWIWTADHQTDNDPLQQRINVYTSRGILVESRGPSWFVAVSSEHCAMYNYQINTKAPIFFALLQSETPYFQPVPPAPTPAVVSTNYSDPEYSANRKSALSLRIVDSPAILIYASTHYSFFSNYTQGCIKVRTCQTEIVSIENSTAHIYNLATIGSTYMLNLDGAPLIPGEANLNQFGDLVVAYLPSSTIQDNFTSPVLDNGIQGKHSANTTSDSAPSGEDGEDEEDEQDDNASDDPGTGMSEHEQTESKPLQSDDKVGSKSGLEERNQTETSSKDCETCLPGSESQSEHGKDALLSGAAVAGAIQVDRTTTGSNQTVPGTVPDQDSTDGADTELSHGTPGSDVLDDESEDSQPPVVSM